MALESGVVDGQHRTQATMERVTREGRAQVDRRQGRVPVVCVHDVGRRRDLWQDRQGRLAEKRESQCVVGIVTGIVAVDPRAVEEVRVLDEEDLRHALGVVVLRAVKPRGFGPSTQCHGEGPTCPLEGLSRLAYLPVQREDHRGRHAHGRLAARQAAHRFAQAAGPGERP